MKIACFYFLFLKRLIIIPLCRGSGVIGEQPVILPGTGFEYSSACPLSTPNGRMVRCDSFVFFISSWKVIKLDRLVLDAASK
jgi:hypothetical protein